MGWTGIPDFPRGQAAEIREVTRLGEGYTVLDVAKVHGVIYAAVRTEQTGQIWALVAATRRYRGEFLYKDMDETMGPNAADCPSTILNRLTATDNRYALEWRERCRQNAARDWSLSPGDRIKLTHALCFGGGIGEVETFEFEGGYRFYTVNAEGQKDRYVRFPKTWRRTYDWTKLA